MHWKGERGFSFVELLMVATVLGFVSTGVKTFVIDRTRGPQRQIARRDLAAQGRASVEQMVRELELSGQAPQPGATDPDTPPPADAHSGAAAFLVAAEDHVVFDADLEGDGVVERVEYRLHDAAIERSAVSKNLDGSVPPAEYKVLTEHVDNGSLPLFRYSPDPASELSAPGDVQSVWVTLLLRPPMLDPKRPQFRTLRFDGLARRQTAEGENAIAELQRP